MTPPASALNLSIDNVWWEPSVARPTPAGGNFGVFTETASHKTAGEFGLGVQGNFFIWENTLVAATQNPYEGSQSISLQSAPGLTWFGAAFTPNVKYNLTAFNNPNGKLRFAMKTSSSTTFMIGMKSGNIDGVGQKWLTFQAGSDPYGFVRDGQWHAVEIPMSDMGPEVDLSQVSQLFRGFGHSGPITGIELDDIYFTGGGALHTNVVSAADSGRGRHQLAHARRHELHRAMDRPAWPPTPAGTLWPARHRGRWHNQVAVRPDRGLARASFTVSCNRLEHWNCGKNNQNCNRIPNAIELLATTRTESI